ncbi:MAG: undecaprenyl/decaprenyl-phosphate alpha-N-acetylglucosaminyl 1-phosphate transferase [Ruminococcaceae bacterium]|nr:undecaprenyl/decaprenyl-phosphate alpha-N-acetylglucosaminyl 1-phosphate transferase [Oscillospiraceae bacterium]
MSQFIYSFCAVLCAGLLAFAMTPIVRVLAIKIKAIDIPTDNRRMHHRPIPRIGGLAIFAAFTVTTLSFCSLSKELLTILIGGSVLVLIGILDDIYRLNAFVKLVVQIAVAVFAVSQGITIDFIGLGGSYIPFGAWSAPITVLWIVGLTNAVNFIDGLDGLACGVSAISSASLFLVMLLSGSSASYCVITAILVGACIGFFPFNANPAKIFMGDTGALFLGYTLSILSVVGVFKTDMLLAFFIPLSIFGLPLFDTAFAIVRRLIHGKSPFEPDRGHLHHRLIDMGFGQKQSVRILYAICALLGISSVMLTRSAWQGGALMLATSLIVFFISFRILSSSKWRSHSGVYNEDDGVKPPVETFDDVGIPTPKYGRNAFVEFDVMGDDPVAKEDKNSEKQRQKK